MLKFLIAAVALLAVAGLTAVSAQEATPTSTITLRFVRDGQPVTIFSIAGHKILADGITCLFPTADEELSEFLTNWPAVAEPSQPLECSKGPPTTLRFEFGGLFAEFLWTGDDVTVDVEVPADTAVPPVGLPITGGPPGDGTPTRNWVVVALVAGLSLLAMPAAAFLYRRS